MTVEYVHGDLFSQSPLQTILLHACNAQGSWGAGVALGFRTRYPQAYLDHQLFCRKYAANHGGQTKGLVGTCQLIPISNNRGMVACLFTSDKFGSKVDSPEMIVDATRAAMADLKSQLNSLKIEDQTIHMPRINSGLFSVPWEMTERVLKESGVSCVVYGID
ncbi:hypothetical protein NADFUDRAFT_19717 [Nadsonia fulvescens var. elongata DSM 6958]|uniref:ADP-ribose 1''-phosphate phosphatase n=1 Tax=Nadsonia fulvescens var. elongata DSM 6958 TaxID=857566 RepID=A0A1E3PT19_9ASCO|nr:hypothetical protein NADFUDRAFT_19717 [Nadsonia fulvescens var. elongata DSM 6958]